MEPTCRFGIEYLPTAKPDPVAELHLRNCPDCQREVRLVA